MLKLWISCGRCGHLNVDVCGSVGPISRLCGADIQCGHLWGFRGPNQASSAIHIHPGSWRRAIARNDALILKKTVQIYYSGLAHLGSNLRGDSTQNEWPAVVP